MIQVHSYFSICRPRSSTAFGHRTWWSHLNPKQRPSTVARFPSFNSAQAPNNLDFPSERSTSLSTLEVKFIDSFIKRTRSWLYMKQKCTDQKKSSARVLKYMAGFSIAYGRCVDWSIFYQYYTVTTTCISCFEWLYFVIGGTVDITAHEVLECGVRELHHATGGACGGSHVDKNFDSSLRNPGFQIHKQVTLC